MHASAPIKRHFTMLEMLVVIVILAVVSGTVLLTGGIGEQREETLSDFAPRLKQVLWELRSRTLTTHQSMALKYDWNENAWQFQDEIQLPLPAETTFLYNGKETTRNESEVEIVFSSLGRGQPVTIVMKAPGEVLLVEISALTGLAYVRWYDEEEYAQKRQQEIKPIFGGDDDWL